MEALIFGAIAGCSDILATYFGRGVEVSKGIEMQIISALAQIGAMRRLVGGALVATSLMATPAHALTINATFGSTITSDSNVVAIENTIDTAISAITSLISNAITVNIFFGSGAIGGLGTSSVALNGASFTSVRAALAADSLGHPSDTVLATAVANLPTGSTAPNGQSTVALTSANIIALGGTPAGCVNAAGAYVSGCSGAGVYAGAITLTNAAGVLDYSRPTASGEYDALRVVEHELDEVLGIGGPGSAINPSNASSYTGMTDLYRYSAPGVNSFTALSSATAYFSVDGGATNLVSANQNSAGDFADFYSQSGCPQYVQDAFSCPGQIADITRSSPEAILLQAIGYNLTTSAPEPASMAMLAIGMVALPIIRRRRKG